MSANRVVSTNDYLSSTKSVLHAGQELQRALKANAPLKKKENAIRQLEQAGQKHDLGATSYRAFMFTEAESEPIADRAPGPQTSEDLFASVLNDLQVAGVYIA